MKTSFPILLALAVLCPATLILTGGCSKADNSNASTVGQDIKTTAIDTWDSIKDFTFEKRTDFSDSIQRMDDKMDAKIADMKAKGTNTSDYDQARADLKARLSDLGNATSDTWAAAKTNVQKAWDRTKAAYDKETS
jgi:hypothetical protein